MNLRRHKITFSKLEPRSALHLQARDFPLRVTSVFGGLDSDLTTLSDALREVRTDTSLVHVAFVAFLVSEAGAVLYKRAVAFYVIMFSSRQSPDPTRSLFV